MRRYQFFFPWSRYLKWWKGVCRSMVYSGRVFYLGLVCFVLWFWRQGSVPRRDRPTLLPLSLVYCGGSIVRRWDYILVWWFYWPILIPFLILVWVEYICCVHARDVIMILKIIDGQPMWRMSKCRVGFVNCGRSFISPAIYKSLSDEIIAVSRSVFRSSSHFCKCIYRRCPSAVDSLVSTSVQMLYRLRSYITVQAKVGCFVYSSL